MSTQRCTKVSKHGIVCRMKSVESFSGDWMAGLVEPADFEAAYPDPQTWPADEANNPDDEWEDVQLELIEEAKREHRALNAIRGKEALDATGEFSLFEGVVVAEGENGDCFRVPPRVLYSPKYGIWQLDVSGRVGFFKSRSDYGQVLHMATGEGGWVPHLYPFEDVDSTGMPVFVVRERAEVQVELTRLHFGDAGEDDKTPELKLKTAHGDFVGSESYEACPYPDDPIRFECYNQVGKELLAFSVHYNGKYELEEIGARNTWQGESNSEIWVPLDLLRAGLVDARITFPHFTENNNE